MTKKHLIKLVVGVDGIEDYANWLAHSLVKFKGKRANVVHTRHMPKIADELIANGASIYRVIKGQVCCRQKLLGFESVINEDGQKYTLMFVEPTLMRTYPLPYRAFQGWRYFEDEKAPDDLGPYVPGEADEGSLELQIELKKLGLI